MGLGGDPSPTPGLGGRLGGGGVPRSRQCRWRQRWGRHPQPAECHCCPKLQMRKLRQTGPAPPPAGPPRRPWVEVGRSPPWGRDDIRERGLGPPRRHGAMNPRQGSVKQVCTLARLAPPSLAPETPSFGPGCVQDWGPGGPPRVSLRLQRRLPGKGAPGARLCRVGQGLGAAGGACISGVGMSLDWPDSRSPHPRPAGPSAGRGPPAGPGGAGGGSNQACAQRHPGRPVTLPGVGVQAGKRRPSEGLCGLRVALSWGVWAAGLQPSEGKGQGPGAEVKGHKLIPPRW